MTRSTCPCGGGRFAECCGPILDDVSRATGVVTWTGLRILDVVGGGPSDTAGRVEFEARFRADGARQVVRERSTFARRAGRWLYVGPEPR